MGSRMPTVPGWWRRRWSASFLDRIHCILRDRFPQVIDESAPHDLCELGPPLFNLQSDGLPTMMGKHGQIHLI